MYDRLLIRPSVAELVETFLAAQAAVDPRADLLSHQRTDWEREAVGFRAQREGRRFWSAHADCDSRRVTVGVVWWTDARGRRHFRIVSREGVPTTDGDPFSRKVGPVLFDLYPDVCAFRILDSRMEWVALCGCGVAVPIATLPDWMGPRCGACEQRGEPFPDRGRILDLGPGDDALPLVDGPGFVVVDWVRFEVRVTDRHGRTLRTFAERRVGQATAVAPDGRFLISVDAQGALHVYDLADGRQVTEQRTTPTVSLRFSPSGTLMAANHLPGVSVYGYDASIGGLHYRTSFDAARGLDWSTRGLRAVTGWYGLFVAYEEGLLERDRPLTWPAPQRLLDPVDPVNSDVYPETPRFTPDGNTLCCLHKHRETGRIVEMSRLRWNGTNWVRQPSVPLQLAAWVDFSPDARWIAGGLGPVEINDAATGTRLGAVGWPDESRPSRFTADGRSLVIHHDGRMKVVPWALLLGAPASGGG